MRRLGVFVALVLLAAGCGGMDPTADLSPSPGAELEAQPVEHTPETAAAEREAAAEPAPTPAPVVGSLEVSVTDRQNRPRPGVPIEIEGPQPMRLTSGAGGMVRADVLPGHYTLRVVTGCTAELEILDGGTGAAAVPPRQTTRGVLVASWRHRYAPGDPTSFEAQDGGPTRRGYVPHWRPGVPYEVTFTVLDRCQGGAPAPDVSYEAFRFEISPNARVLDASQTVSDGEGRGRLRAQCHEGGVINLHAVDGENPAEDRIDLLVGANQHEGRPICSQ